MCHYPGFILRRFIVLRHAHVLVMVAPVPPFVFAVLRVGAVTVRSATVLARRSMMMIAVVVVVAGRARSRTEQATAAFQHRCGIRHCRCA